MLEARGILPTDLIERLLKRVTDGAKRFRDPITQELEASVPEVISCAASLAHHGLLQSLNHLAMIDVDLRKISSQHLISLASCVTDILDITNVRGCDMIALLDSVNCRVLYIDGQNLRTDDTQALVRAMETRVKNVMLGHKREVTLDIEALTQYNGQGKCWYIMMGLSSPSGGREKKLRNWLQLVANWSLKTNPSYAYDLIHYPGTHREYPLYAVLVRKYLLRFENGKRFIIH